MMAEGPLYKTQRVEIPATGTYVEIRQTRSTYIVWEIEHGTLAYGHKGTWGRDDVAYAFRTFAEAVEFETRKGQR